MIALSVNIEYNKATPVKHDVEEINMQIKLGNSSGNSVTEMEEHRKIWRRRLTLRRRQSPAGRNAPVTLIWR